MKKWGLILLISTPAFSVTPVITPSTPVVNQGGTIQFTETNSDAGTWSCSATTSTGGVTACQGSINGSGLYTAPSSVTALHVYGGMQVAPNSAVYNIRVDSAPLHPNNTLYMNTVNTGGTPAWDTDFPLNYVNASNTDTMNFFYTTANDGSFEIPAFPNAKAEHGWFSALQNLNDDHHVVMVDTATGNLSEIYKYYPNCITTAASVTNGIATLTCTKNPQANAFIVGSSIAVGGFTGADTYFNVTNTSMTAVTSTSISYALSHANASATTNGSASKDISDTTGFINANSGITYSSMTYLLPPISTDAAGMELQPYILGLQEFERAVTTGGTINHAMRITFGIGFEASASTWPATQFAVDGATIPFGARMRLKQGYNISGFSPYAQVLLNTLKQYGAINCDGGNNWVMNAEQTRWPKAYYDSLAEIDNAVIVSSMEFVDESGFMISTNSALSKNNRELIKFTRTSDNATAFQDVLLMGPAVNFQNDYMQFMAGTPATQIPVLNNYGGFTCSMAPATGTLTSGCLYTPPTTVSASTSIIVYATSTINSNANAQMTLVVYPSTGIYVIPSQTSNYADSQGNTWTARAGIDNSPDNQGCCACDNSSHFAAITDVTLWNCQVGASSNASPDTHMDFYVPNGQYQVVYHYGTEVATGGQFIKYSIGNTEIYSNTDPSAVAGGQYQFFTSTNTTVTNNLLQVGIWNMNDVGAPVSSLSLVRTGNIPSSSPKTFSGGCTIIGGGTFQ